MARAGSDAGERRALARSSVHRAPSRARRSGDDGDVSSPRAGESASLAASISRARARRRPRARQDAGALHGRRAEPCRSRRPRMAFRPAHLAVRGPDPGAVGGAGSGRTASSTSSPPSSAMRELLELGAQRLARDAEQLGGARLVAGAHLERVLDRHALDLGERPHDVRPGTARRGAAPRPATRPASDLGGRCSGQDSSSASSSTTRSTTFCSSRTLPGQR